MNDMIALKLAVGQHRHSGTPYTADQRQCMYTKTTYLHLLVVEHIAEAHRTATAQRLFSLCIVQELDVQTSKSNKWLKL